MGMMLTYHEGYYGDEADKPAEKPARKPRKPKAEAPADESHED